MAEINHGTFARRCSLRTSKTVQRKNQRELYKMRSFFKPRAFNMAALFIELYPQLSKDPGSEKSTSGVVGFQGVRPGEREDLRKSL